MRKRYHSHELKWGRLIAVLISIFTIAQTTDICYSAGASFVNVQITLPGSRGTLRAIYLENVSLGLRVIGCRPTLWEGWNGSRAGDPARSGQRR